MSKGIKFENFKEKGGLFAGHRRTSRKLVQRDETFRACQAIHGADADNDSPVLAGLLDTSISKFSRSVVVKKLLVTLQNASCMYPNGSNNRCSGRSSRYQCKHQEQRMVQTVHKFTRLTNKGMTRHNFVCSARPPLSSITIIIKSTTIIYHYHRQNHHHLELSSSQPPPFGTIIITTTTIWHYFHQNHHHLSLSPSKPPPSATIIITATTNCHYHHHSHHQLSLSSS